MTMCEGGTERMEKLRGKRDLPWLRGEDLNAFSELLVLYIF